ncbi:unnamed protein product [Pedinophyceae sp. YPF-701]|nr:unnamed protein product [Pedinophyceae sp. YPF-701]
MLALCNVDPVAANREAAAGAFAQYVAARRRAAAQELQRGGAGGGSMAAQPELCLTYAVFLLAHHPDFPTVGEVRDTSGAALAPFQQMLAPLLGALLGTAEDSCEAGASLPLVRKLLRVIKHSEVTAPGLRGEEPRTQEVRELADVALQMAAAAEEVILGPRGATATSARAAPYPGDVQLPRWVLRAVAVEGGSFADGSHIPRGLAAPDMRPHLGLAKKGGARRGEGAAKRGRQGAEVGSPPRARSKQAKVRSPDAASKRRRFGAEAVGCRVEVWWPEDEGWFAGTVESFDEASGRHRVAYDDGDVEHLFLPQERIRWEGGDSPGKEGPDAGSPLPPTPARATRALRSVAGNTPGGAPPSEKRRTVRGRQGRTPRAQENATAE